MHNINFGDFGEYMYTLLLLNKKHIKYTMQNINTKTNDLSVKIINISLRFTDGSSENTPQICSLLD